MRNVQFAIFVAVLTHGVSHGNAAPAPLEVLAEVEQQGYVEIDLNRPEFGGIPFLAYTSEEAARGRRIEGQRLRASGLCQFFGFDPAAISTVDGTRESVEALVLVEGTELVQDWFGHTRVEYRNVHPAVFRRLSCRKP